MKNLRIAIAQINPCVGDFDGNKEKIASYIDQAKARASDIVVFPELAVCGYPPEDLLFKQNFIRKNRECLFALKSRTSGITAVIGFVDSRKNNLFNSAAVLSGGKLIDVYHKNQLPNYGVFDEKRYFSAGQNFSLYRLNGICFGMNICEDLWIQDGIADAQSRAGAQLIIALNASPYHMGKINLRRKILTGAAKKNKVTIAYANTVGGQDELVFDGQSMILAPNGRLFVSARAFAEELCVCDLEFASASARKAVKKRVKMFDLGTFIGQKKQPLKVIAPPKLSQEEEVFQALVIGTKDYVSKNNFKKVVLGLSGGIDSSLVACVAKEALGPENIAGVIMPSKFNSPQSYDDAVMLAKNLGIEFKIIFIQEIFDIYLKALKPHFKEALWNVAEENLQARIRGNLLMALSNKFGWLVLTTGNKSELSVGYATLYGDMAGGFAVIKDVTKTLVYAIAEFYNRKCGFEAIPRPIFTKPPSAELKENQKDSDSLPPYEVLDPILRLYVEEYKPASQILQKGFNPQDVLKTLTMVDRSEYKRRQAPPGIKITPLAFGRDRRMPITNRFKE